MYNETPEQTRAASELRKQGFQFSNWIDAQNGIEGQGTMIVAKRGATKYGREYREIEPDGTVN